TPVQDAPGSGAESGDQIVPARRGWQGARRCSQICVQPRLAQRFHHRAHILGLFAGSDEHTFAVGDDDEILHPDQRDEDAIGGMDEAVIATDADRLG
ncbi:hypothetical protein RZS08_43675, partial [Arthrospira platensis SPKY1]|nr:hypothetical protein [Arthrospira platensis SPKY1]